MQLTLKQIITRLESLAKSHLQINSVFVGDLNDLLSNKDVVYPACVIEVAENNLIDIPNKVQRHGFRVHFFDLLNVASQSQSNELDVQSDLTSIAGDFIAMINYNEYLQDWQTPDTYNLQLGTFRLSDVCVGVFFDLPIGAFYLADRCQVPATGITFEADKEVPIIINSIFVITENVNTKINNTTYIALAEATSLLLPQLTNKDIMMVFLGDKLLTPTENSPTPNEYRYTKVSGLFEFGTDLQIDQVLQILNRAIL